MSDTPGGVLDLSTEEAIHIHCYKPRIVLFGNSSSSSSYIGFTTHYGF
jgi:hypothetical protein